VTKEKVKFVPLHAQSRIEGRDVWLHPLLTSAVGGSESSIYVPAALPPRWVAASADQDVSEQRPSLVSAHRDPLDLSAQSVVSIPPTLSGL
jgi:hypothetical protein